MYFDDVTGFQERNQMLSQGVGRVDTQLRSESTALKRALSAHSMTVLTGLLGLAEVCQELLQEKVEVNNGLDILKIGVYRAPIKYKMAPDFHLVSAALRTKL